MAFTEDVMQDIRHSVHPLIECRSGVMNYISEISLIDDCFVKSYQTALLEALMSIAKSIDELDDTISEMYSDFYEKERI